MLNKILVCIHSVFNCSYNCSIRLLFLLSWMSKCQVLSIWLKRVLCTQHCRHIVRPNGVIYLFNSVWLTFYFGREEIVKRFTSCSPTRLVLNSCLGNPRIFGISNLHRNFNSLSSERTVENAFGSHISGPLLSIYRASLKGTCLNGG